jgi:hypothetical protein
MTATRKLQSRSAGRKVMKVIVTAAEALDCGAAGATQEALADHGGALIFGRRRKVA